MAQKLVLSISLLIIVFILFTKIVFAETPRIVELRNSNQFNISGIVLSQPELDVLESSSFDNEPSWEQIRTQRIENLINKKLDRIHFDFDSAELGPESKKVIAEIVEILNKNQDVGINLYGHTDLMGENRYNLLLSHNRVQAVYNSLLRSGIAPIRVVTHAHGETQPLVAVEEKERLNRRVEARVFDLLPKINWK